MGLIGLVGRVVLLFSLLSSLLVAAAPAANAAPDSPYIRDAHWTGGEVQARRTEYVSIRAVDRDGVIVGAIVHFGDRTYTVLDILCAADTPDGIPYLMYIPHEYRRPGRYRVRVVAISADSCPEAFETTGSEVFKIPTQVT